MGLRETHPTGGHRSCGGPMGGLPFDGVEGIRHMMKFHEEHKYDLRPDERLRIVQVWGYFRVCLITLVEADSFKNGGITSEALKKTFDVIPKELRMEYNGYFDVGDGFNGIFVDFGSGIHGHFAVGRDGTLGEFFMNTNATSRRKGR
jgi:hypothetical protein